MISPKEKEEKKTYFYNHLPISYLLLSSTCYTPQQLVYIGLGSAKQKVQNVPDLKLHTALTQLYEMWRESTEEIPSLSRRTIGHYEKRHITIPTVG